MFPVSDFSFMACGMATVAATVGYVCAKKIRSDPSHRHHEPEPSHLLDQEVRTCEKPAFKDEVPPVSTESTNGTDVPPPNTVSIEILAESQDTAIKQAEIAEDIVEPSTMSNGHAPEASSDSELGPVIVLPVFVPALSTTVERRRSLKRKQMHDHDENNIPLEYPYNLTALYPNKRNKTPPRETKTADDENVPVVRTSSNSQEIKPAMQPETKRQRCTIEVDEPQVQVPTPSLHEITGSKVESSAETSNTVTPTSDPAPASNPDQVSIVPPRPPPPPPPVVAFEIFASSGSSLSFGNMGSLASGTNVRPAWSTSSSFRKRHGFIDNVDDGPNSSQSGSRSQSPFHAIESSPPAAQSMFSHVTGEEDEDIKCELKGAKLYVKRGSSDFSGGMLGHVKLLSNKRTLDERLLFRREPLWKVSMNTRLRPSVRCTFDSEDCILRLVLAESVEQSGLSLSDGKREIVVYALKPGRFCPKQEFQDFAQSVLSSKHLCADDRN